MRCSCKVCGPEVWMVQAESAALGCVCPECGYRCADCLGTDTVSVGMATSPPLRRTAAAIPGTRRTRTGLKDTEDTER